MRRTAWRTLPARPWFGNPPASATWNQDFDHCLIYCGHIFPLPGRYLVDDKNTFFYVARYVTSQTARRRQFFPGNPDLWKNMASNGIYSCSGYYSCTKKGLIWYTHLSIIDSAQLNSCCCSWPRLRSDLKREKKSAVSMCHTIFSEDQISQIYPECFFEQS